MPQSQKNSGDDAGLNLMAGLAGVIIMPVVLWFVFHTQISTVFLPIFGAIARMWAWAPWAQTEHHHAYMAELSRVISVANRSEITWIQFLWLGNKAMQNLLPLLIPAGLLIIRSIRHVDDSLAFKSKMDLSALAERMSVAFPASTPVLDLDLISGDPDVGPWRRMDDYLGFALRHQLLRTRTNKVITERSDEIRASFFDERMAFDVFAKQLGPQTSKCWASLIDDRPHAAALAAVFAARINRKTSEANDILDQLARSYVAGDGKSGYQMDLSMARKAWDRYAHTEAVSEIAGRHAHLHCSLSLLLHKARYESGVLQPAWFIWLKPVDRTLWYALHQVGLRVGAIEAGGVRAQMLAEDKNKGSISNPMVEQAVVALRMHLIDELWLVDTTSGADDPTKLDAEAA